MLCDAQIERMLGKLERFERVLDGMIFAPVASLDARALPNASECLRTPPEFEAMRPIEKGFEWGGELSYCWFAARYTVPKSLAGKTLYLRPFVGGDEALFFVDGRPFGTFNTKIEQYGHGNHYCGMIALEARPGATLELALEAFAGRYVIGTQPMETAVRPSYRFCYDRLEVCLRDELVTDACFNLRTFNQLVRALPKDSFARARYIQALHDVHDALVYYRDDSSEEEFRAALTAANDCLKPLFAYRNAALAPVAAIIGHSHMDTAWLWTIPETVRKCARTYSNQMSLMEQYPEHNFIQSSTYHSLMMKRYYPALYEDIKKRVAEGRYEPNGGVFVECDCNITGGETMIRQFVWGQRFTQSEFGYTSDSFWLPDTFGYSAVLPQIMRGCGVKYFLTTKIAWNDTNVFPYDTFLWRGMDGTQVLAHFNKTHLWPDPKTCIELLENGGSADDKVREKTVSNTRLLAYGYGDGGGGPQFEMLELARRCKDIEGCPKVEHMTVSRFMNQLERSLVRPSVYSGELYLEIHRGTLTNQHEIKRNNRLGEMALHNLEYLTARAAAEAGETCEHAHIDPLMETMLVNQFHDILPGTCVTDANGQSKREMAKLITDVNALSLNYAQAEPRADALSLINALSFAYTDAVRVPCRSGKRVVGGVVQQRTQNVYGEPMLALSGLSIPAYGAAQLRFEDGEPEAGKAIAFDGTVVETPLCRAELDENNFIASYYDKRAGRELRGRGRPLNTLLLGEDVSLQWDNWDIDADCEERLKPCVRLLSSEVVSSGAVELRLRSRYQLDANVTITQDMVFYADSPRVDFETLMDWRATHRLLKAEFDTPIFTDVARQEIQFGYVKRPTTRSTAWEKARFEACNHKYSDLSEPNYGVAVLNDCKYGASVLDGAIRLTLHKGGNRPDPTGDKGLHYCRYAFLPHAEAFGAGSVIRPAYMFNYLPLAVEGSAPTGSFASCNAPNVIIETIKPCEDAARAYVLRAYEAQGDFAHAEITLERGARATITDMLENPIGELPAGDKLALTFRPFEIKTIRVEY